MRYEPTAVEFEGAPLPVEQWTPLKCIHCGKSIGYHWQTAEGKLFCTRKVTPSDAAAAKLHNPDRDDGKP